MTSGRIYGAASGRCLVRDGDAVDEAEKKRVQRDFHAGIRLVVDPDHDEVRGFVPATRQSDEAFFAVVDVTPSGANEPHPLETFYTTVETIFEERPQWSLRDDVPEGEPFEGRGRREPPILPEGVASRRSDAVRDDPVRLGVADIVTAVDVIEQRLDRPLTDSVAVGLRMTDRVAYDVLFVLREGEMRLTRMVETADDAETDSRLVERIRPFRILWQWLRR